MSHLMAKPTTWQVRPAKTQISLGIRPVWSVFAVRMKKPWVLSYQLSAQRRLWSDWTDAHFVGFVMRWLIYIVDVHVIKNERKATIVQNFLHGGMCVTSRKVLKKNSKNIYKTYSLVICRFKQVNRIFNTHSQEKLLTEILKPANLRRSTRLVDSLSGFPNSSKNRFIRIWWRLKWTIFSLKCHKMTSSVSTDIFEVS